MAIAIGVVLDVAIPHTSVALHWVEGLVVAVPCVWLAIRVVRWRTTRLLLTYARIIEQWGVLVEARAVDRTGRHRHVAVVRSLLRRVVGTGRIELVTGKAAGSADRGRAQAGHPPAGDQPPAPAQPPADA